MDEPRHPPAAFHFDACRPEIAPCSAQTAEAGGANGGRRRFRGTAYSGRPLRHPYWGVVAFDLSTTTAPEPVPVLVDHDRARRAGFATLRIGSSIEIEDGVLLDNAEGRAIADESDAGFPWQMSVHIEPGRIEEIKDGATAAVNGHDVHGPAYVFRDNLIREVSFTPTGVDHETRAEAMSVPARPHPRQHHAEEPDMSENELEKQLSDLQASLEDAERRAREATERAEQAERMLEAMRREQRMSAVKALFQELGRELTEEAARPYLEMSDETFEAVARDLRALRPSAPEHLFRAEAAGQDAPDGNLADMLIRA